MAAVRVSKSLILALSPDSSSPTQRISHTQQETPTMVSMRTLMTGLLVLGGTLNPLDMTWAATFQGNLYYSDGVSTLTDGDTALVEVYDAAGNQLIKTLGGATIVTMTGNTGYTITLAPGDFSNTDKNITIKYKLNGT